MARATPKRPAKQSVRAKTPPAGARSQPPDENSAADQPPRPDIPLNANTQELANAAKTCKACDLWRQATQTVFGAGAARPKILFVGEQPGNQEDLEGKPFVGPAGKLLDRALEEAGIDRAKTYVTNAVKHFKWEPRGKRRIHKKPNTAEIAACRPWLDAEIAALQPEVIVCLGATAAQALLGRDFRVTQHRCELLPGSALRASPAEETRLRKQPDIREQTAHQAALSRKQAPDAREYSGAESSNARAQAAREPHPAAVPYIMATVHPSSILRAPDEETRHAEMQRFVDDLKKLARFA